MLGRLVVDNSGVQDCPDFYIEAMSPISLIHEENIEYNMPWHLIYFNHGNHGNTSSDPGTTALVDVILM